MVFLWPSPKPLCFQQSWGLWGRLHGVATGLQKGSGGCRVGSRSFRRGAVEVASGAQIPPAVRGAMVAHLPDAPRRRLNTKQSRPPAFPRPGAAGVWAHALRAEQCAADGLVALLPDARRTHVHYTHVRTTDPQAVQPSQLTRRQFWQHLVKCYREAYPDASSGTGSILKFGLVVKELHKQSSHKQDREEHHHAPTFSSEKHLWKKIRKISAEKYRIHLNAVAHDCYTTMFEYVRQPSAKKPFHELDAKPYFSPDHPHGEELRQLLETGAKYRQARAANLPRDPQASSVRSQFGSVYKWVIDKNLKDAKGATRLQADAVDELKRGNPKLIEFVKKHKSNLEDQLAFCWELHDAPQRLERMEKSRLELLLEAATSAGSSCANAEQRCVEMYESILEYQSIDSGYFRHLIFEGLKHGRRKGNAVMLVGPKDTGKTTVTEPMGKIYACMHTPQSDSFCPLEGCRGHEVAGFPIQPRPSQLQGGRDAPR